MKKKGKFSPKIFTGEIFWGEKNAMWYECLMKKGGKFSPKKI